MFSQQKMTVTKVGENQIHLVPKFSKIGGTGSHSSHWVVVPMMQYVIMDEHVCLHEAATMCERLDWSPLSGKTG